MKEFGKAFKNAFSYIFTIAFFGACFAYAYVFSQYHKAVTKHKHLTEIVNNPRARVASGEKAQ